MAAKLLHSLTDDNPDLQKQIGCMNGIFQLFDRQHMLTGRRITRHNLKKLPPGSSHINDGTSETESYGVYHPQTPKEKTCSKNVYEKQRFSTESSRPSFSSSSRSSSFSSLDCNRTAQPEASSFDRIIFPETPSRDPAVNQSSSSPRVSLDIRDVVKDSMYRETRGISVKSTKDEAKHKDSPRPLHLSKSMDGTNEKKVPADLKESLRALAKLREAPWYFNEERARALDESRDGKFSSNPKDAPRFSCDGREVNNFSYESRDTFKSSPKLKELPRLSLDSREGFMRSSNTDSKSTFLLKNSQDSGTTSERTGTQSRPSLVAKLMGLEALPHDASASDNQMSLIKTCHVENCDSLSKLLKPTDSCRPSRSFSPSKNSWKEPTSPRWKNPDSAVKPNSRFPIEPAPWKQQQADASRGTQKQSLRHLKAPQVPPRSTNSYPSVYSEIEKRLKDLEFTQSGKDLRALKQILEAMQVKGLLDHTQKDQEPRYVSTNQKVRVENQRKPQNRGDNSSTTFESPIVIMKPAKLVEKSVIHSSSVIPIDGLSGLPKLRNGDSVGEKKVSTNGLTAKDHILKTYRRDSSLSSNDTKVSSRNPKSRPQELPKENTTSSVKSSASVSPRLQQKKLELERLSRPPTPPSDSSKSRRQPSKQQPESVSPGGKRRLKLSNLQQSNDLLCENSRETGNLVNREDNLSLQLDSSTVLEAKTEIKLTVSDRSTETNGSRSPSMKAANYSVSRSISKRSSAKTSEAGPLTELATVSPEHPSPISVLDHSIYKDDVPSPVKQIPNKVRDDATRTLNNGSSKEQRDPADNILPNSSGSVISDINRKKLQSIENLVQKLRRLNSSHDEARTDYIASLCENTNPDDRYISEILLASGLLLRDLGSSMTTFQLHPSGHPINPELFLVLEQTKGGTFSKEECSTEKAVNLKPDKEKFHRKLIFDAVNEILLEKLAFIGKSSELWLKPKKMTEKTLNPQKLLRELCSEIEQIQAKKQDCVSEDEDDGLKNILCEDVMRRSEDWTYFQGDISCVVLDVERLIFKDLVDEIVIGESAGFRAKPGRRCRLLFAK